MRIVFFGTSEFAVPALEAVAPHVVLAVSQPERPSGRGLGERPSPVHSAALRLGIEVATPRRASEAGFVARVAGLEPDLLLVAAYGQILRQPLLEAGRRGSFNLHGSVLPAWRGAAPIQRSIQAGCEETGVTLMQMDAGLDTGDVVAIERTAVGPDETAGELTVRLADLAARMARQWLPRLASGEYPRTPQDGALATHAPKLEREEGRIDPAGAALEEYRRFRAFTPRPGAFLRLADGTELKVLRARLAPEATGEPGAVWQTRPELVLCLAQGGIALHEVQAPGRRAVSGRDWANGARLAAGRRFVP
jgi:methionyl-tRNA formyltransferase